MAYTIGLGDTILQDESPRFLYMMIVIINSNLETIKQIYFLLDLAVATINANRNAMAKHQ